MRKEIKNLKNYINKFIGITDKILEGINKEGVKLNKPDKRRIKEMIRGIIIGKTPQFSSCARAQSKSPYVSKETLEKRYYRLFNKFTSFRNFNEILFKMKSGIMNMIVNMVNVEDDEVIVIDTTSIDKDKYGNFEDKQPVYSGSKKKTVLGYPLMTAILLKKSFFRFFHYHFA